MCFAMFMAIQLITPILTAHELSSRIRSVRQALRVMCASLKSSTDILGAMQEPELFEKSFRAQRRLVLTG